MAELERILEFLDDTFRPAEFPDYPDSWNGLQVEGPPEIGRVGAAVDASEAVVTEAVRRGVHLLLVHHGLFWGGAAPLTGPRFRKVAALIRGGTALYSLHLPLDAHPEMGNNALLIRAVGLEPAGPFGSFKGVPVGWWAEADLERDELAARLRGATGEGVRLIPGGPAVVKRLGVLTGSGASALQEAARSGLQALVTGEAPHHAYHEAMELGINLYLGGHYATEVFGVRALGARLGEMFDLPWDFLHFPTGL